jgi:hypothetical protein
MSPLDLLGTEGTLFLHMLQPFVRVANKGQENLSNMLHGYLPRMMLACVPPKELQIVLCLAVPKIRFMTLNQCAFAEDFPFKSNLSRIYFCLSREWQPTIEPLPGSYFSPLNRYISC